MNTDYELFYKVKDLTELNGRLNKKEFIKYFQQNNETKQKRILIVLNFLYFLGIPIIKDEFYDKLFEMFQNQKDFQKLPESMDQIQLNNDEKVQIVNLYKEYYPQFSKKQIEIQSNDSKLPIQMPSLKKVHPDKKMKNVQYLHLYYDFLSQQIGNQGKMNISIKLDGVSVLYCYNNGNINLYTKGTGINGRDITNFAKYLNIPLINKKNDKLPQQFIIRGEIVIQKQKYLEKYSRFSHPRNVSTQINKKYISEIEDIQLLNDLDIVFYQFIGIQIEQCQQLGFKIVKNTDIDIKNKDQEQIINEIKTFQYQNQDYPSDGIVIQKQLKNEDNLEFLKNHTQTKNTIIVPSDKLAMKFQDQIVDTIVQNVEWNISKSGKLVPIVIFDTVKIDGVNINKATGFNAKYIKENCIGKGSLIQVIRSGQVIPYIFAIKTKTQPIMPTFSYYFDDKEIDIYIDLKQDNQECLKEQMQKQLTQQLLLLFQKQNTEGIAGKYILQILQNLDCKINCVIDFILIDQKYILQLGQKKGFGQRKIQAILKILDDIQHQLQQNPLITLSQMSLCDGITSFILEEALRQSKQNIQQFLSQSDYDMQKQYIQFLGFGEKKIQIILQFKKKVFELMQKYQIINEYVQQQSTMQIKEEQVQKDDCQKNYNKDICGKIFTITGTRDDKIIDVINRNNGVFTNLYNKKTDILIVYQKKEFKISNKIEQSIKDKKQIYIIYDQQLDLQNIQEQFQQSDLKIDELGENGLKFIQLQQFLQY